MKINFPADTTLYKHDSLKTLDSDQHLLHDTILYYYTEILNNNEDDTDKTYLIIILSTTLQNLAETQDLSISII
ncbi:uncharacterized protein BDCG_17394 [Blastomyces dermatitidis ER-3]|uniref:Uncharacterized protein n=1 Tax=Ajellomyces dermatitidis (strain ER-3 / ATCC MYA-2586) TaxID=559297 RepID=A0ABX2VY86_AJEDR|nr:uncharacterized protein BDCG_17394 [Blastomyces dermatitidis ER-3]OAT02117.1 hypothetical protein BDCG_17394 [Blastomyces dermatitidis ER-3]